MTVRPSCEKNEYDGTNRRIQIFSDFERRHARQGR